PVQPGSVAVGEGDGAAIAGDYAHLFVGGWRGCPGEDTGRLAGQPDGAQTAYGAGELLAPVRGDVVQDGRVVDNQGGAAWRLSCQCGQVGEQVTAVHGGRTAAGRGDRGLQPRPAVALPRPDQAG